MIQPGEASWTGEGFLEDNRGKLVVMFYNKPIQSNVKTMEAGRPIFEDRTFIKKLVPGDSTMNIDRPIRPEDQEEFPREWAAWVNKKQNVVRGTPLNLWPELSDTQKAEFNALNIFTVEQFAGLPDSAGTKIMGFNEFRLKARAFVSINSAAKRSEKEEEQARKIEEQAQLIKSMQETLQSMQAAIPVKRGRGRPPSKVIAELPASA